MSSGYSEVSRSSSLVPQGCLPYPTPKINLKNLQKIFHPKTAQPKTTLPRQSTTRCPQKHHIYEPKSPKTPAKNTIHHKQKIPDNIRRDDLRPHPHPQRTARL